jgi:tetratricopeptide (TPR) repeat protein
MILYRLGEEPGPEMIERALTAARTAVRLNASSARANIVLADALLSRGLFADAQETAERALALNPLDPVVSFYYAAVLVLAGDIDKGDAALRDVFASLSDPPQRAYFIAFVADYVRGNLQAAAQHAGRLTLSPYTPALLARTLAAWKAGDQERARQAIALLTATQRGWTTDPRGEIGRLFPLPEMAERFAADFDAASRFAFP